MTKKIFKTYEEAYNEYAKWRFRKKNARIVDHKDGFEVIVDNLFICPNCQNWKWRTLSKKDKIYKCRRCGLEQQDTTKFNILENEHIQH